MKLITFGRFPIVIVWGGLYSLVELDLGRFSVFIWRNPRPFWMGATIEAFKDKNKLTHGNRLISLRRWR